jgi:hypothetical protein
MARRKNTKRIDPRYFLHETTHRNLNEAEYDIDLEAPVDPQENLQRDIKIVAYQINRWFNARAQGNTGFRGTNLSDYLRKGASGEEIRHSGLPSTAIINFKDALAKVAPENVEEFKELFMKLADGVEQDPSLLDSKKLGKKGDWHAVAKSL